MDAIDAKRRIEAQLMKGSGFDTGRKYLGMSRITECPARLFRECLHGRAHEYNEATARRCYRGNLYEKDAHARMAAAGIYREGSGREVRADFDERFRGHTDGETLEGDLLEIKSVNHETFDQVRRSRRAMDAHYAQVQLYMRFGGYGHALIVYIDTETFSHFVAEIWPDERNQERLIERARMVLAAIDAGTPPVCTCGRCFGFGKEPNTTDTKGTTEKDGLRVGDVMTDNIRVQP
jgi:hypothetical protein